MANLNEKVVFDLIGQIYESATQMDGEGWRDVFDRLSDVLQSGPGSIHLYFHGQERFDAFADTNEPGFQDDFNSIYFPILPFRDALLRLKPGEVFVRSQDCPDEIFVPSVLYQEHFRELGIFHVVHANLMDMDGATSGITLTRPESLSDFDRLEMEAFQYIMPHLQRAMQMYMRLLEADGRNSMFEEAWNRVPQGVVIVTEAGKITFMNLAAKKFFGTGKPLRSDRTGQIASSDSSQTSTLRSLIASVFNPRSAKAGGYGGTMKLKAANFRRPLSIMVAPFTERFGTSGLFDRQAMILITDPLESDHGSAADLRSMYGLTPTESRVAMLLAEGLSIQEISEILGVAQNTTRTHLKRVFGKTDTNRQGSLIKLVLATPRSHRP